MLTNENEKSLKFKLLNKIQEMADDKFSVGYFEDAMKKLKELSGKGFITSNSLVLSKSTSSDKNYKSFDFIDKIGESKSFFDIVKNIKAASKKLDINQIQKKAMKLFGVKLPIISKNSDGTYNFLKNPISEDFYGSLERDLKSKVYNLNFEEVSKLFFEKETDIESSRKQLNSRIKEKTNFEELGKLFDDLWELISLMKILSPQFGDVYLTIRIFLDRETLELSLHGKNDNGYQNFNVAAITIDKELILRSKLMLASEIKTEIIKSFVKLLKMRYQFCINKTMETDTQLLGSVFDIPLLDEEVLDQKMRSIFESNRLAPINIPISEREIIFESVKRVLEL